jgi:hypothetical protein
MSDRTYAVTEIVGTSPENVDQAIRNGIQRASETLRHLDWFECHPSRNSPGLPSRNSPGRPCLSGSTGRRAVMSSRLVRAACGDGRTGRP